MFHHLVIILALQGKRLGYLCFTHFCLSCWYCCRHNKQKHFAWILMEKVRPIQMMMPKKNDKPYLILLRICHDCVGLKKNNSSWCLPLSVEILGYTYYFWYVDISDLNYSQENSTVISYWTLNRTEPSLMSLVTRGSSTMTSKTVCLREGMYCMLLFNSHFNSFYFIISIKWVHLSDRKHTNITMWGCMVCISLSVSEFWENKRERSKSIKHKG